MNCIFLFGPSCSGKSTLGKSLQEDLGNEWHYVDRDDLIEQGICEEADADAALEKRIQHIKNKVIIDAQIPWREKRNGEFYFMILPPLEILLERDAKRTATLQRSEKRAYYAREYVVTTHKTLSDRDKKDIDFCFDSQEPIRDEIERIKSIVEAAIF